MSAMSHPVRLVVALTTAALVLGACGSDPAPENSTAAPEVRTVATDEGEISVPADPARIVVLNSALAGYLYALDVPVHGAIPLNTDSEEWPASFAEDAEEDGTVMIPWSDDGFDLEAIAAEDPDLIIAGGQGFPAVQAAQVRDQLVAIAPTVLVSRSLTTWQEQLHHLATEVLDVPDGEAELVAAYEQRVEEVREAIDVPATPVSYLLFTPDMTPFTVPEDASLPATLAEVGLTPAPVVAEHPEFGTYGSGDSIELSPEVVGQVFTYPTVFVMGFQSDFTSAAEVGKDPLYAGLPAFASGAAFDLPYWAHRADYDATMALLDLVESELG